MIKQLFNFSSVFILLILFSNFYNPFFSKNSEFDLIEILQNILLIYCLVLNFQYRKLFIRVSNLFTFLIRQFLILFILYEELSFLTFNITNLNNHQQEFNLHNSHLMEFQLFTLAIPNSNLSYTLTLSVVLLVITPVFLGYGSYLPIFKKIKYFFLEKQYAIYTFVFVVNFILTTIFRISNVTSKFLFIKGEVLELFIYFLFFIDTLKKRKVIREKSAID